MGGINLDVKWWVHSAGRARKGTWAIDRKQSRVYKAVLVLWPMPTTVFGI